MNLLRSYWLAIFWSTLFVPYCAALNILDAYVLALDNDPTFHAALKANEAGQEYLAIGRAALLPKVNYSYNKGHNDSEVTTFTSTTRKYKSYTSTFSLQQPLFDYAAWAEYRQGATRALMSDEIFRDKSQDLAIRLFTAYSEALLSEQVIILSKAQQHAYQEQLQLNRKLYKEGEGTRTDILETEARLQLAIAEYIEAQDNLDAALRELQTIIGTAISINQLTPLKASFVVLPLKPTKFEVWRDKAVAYNANLKAQRYAVDVADYELKKKLANHLPTVNFYANNRKSSSDSDSTYNQKYNTKTVGIQLSMPLFAGGGNLAASRQASKQKAQAQYELDDKVSATVKELRKQFNLINSSKARIQAFDLAVKSASTLVMATKKSVQAGERVNLDVLNAEQQFFSAKKNLADAQHAYLRAWLTLRYLSGQLGEENLQELASYFFE